MLVNFGCELEIASIERHEAIRACENVRFNRAQVHNDSSIKPFGQEIVLGVYKTDSDTFPSGEGAQHFIRDLNSIIEDLPDHAHVNNSCGLHVHVSCDKAYSVGLSDIDYAVFQHLFKIKSTWWPNRNKYCTRREFNLSNHYNAINIRGYAYMHLEFRSGNGCLNLRGIIQTVKRAIKQHEEIHSDALERSTRQMSRLS